MQKLNLIGSHVSKLPHTVRAYVHVLYQYIDILIHIHIYI